MQLYELVNKYHIDTDLSCAEAMFKACNEYYELNLLEETRKMFAIMGLGMQTDLSCCGAFTVAMGMIGLTTLENGQKDVDNIIGYKLADELTDFVVANFNTLQCQQLKQLEFENVENPCHVIVEAIAKKLEALLPQKQSYLN